MVELRVQTIAKYKFDYQSRWGAADVAIQEKNCGATWLKEQDFVCTKSQQVPVRILLLEVPSASHAQLAQYLAVKTAVDRIIPRTLGTK